MLERAADKVRFYELAPAAPAWVHTIEVSTDKAPANFVTVWVTAAGMGVFPPMAELVAADPALDRHDPATFHADDETYAWIDRRYGGRDQGYWRIHYHWRFGNVPDGRDVATVLSALPAEAVSPALRAEIDSYFAV